MESDYVEDDFGLGIFNFCGIFLYLFKKKFLNFLTKILIYTILTIK